MNRYGGVVGVRRMTYAEQFRVMAFAQLTWRESLRDIEVTLGANVSKLYAMGLRHSILRSTLADANESRDWQIWCDVSTYVLIAIVKKEFQIDALLYTLLQILSVSVFEKTELYSAFQGGELNIKMTGSANQLNLFEN